MKRITIILFGVNCLNVSQIESAINIVGLDKNDFVFVDHGDNTDLGIIEDLNSECLALEILLSYLIKLMCKN